MITVFCDGALEPTPPANGYAVCAFVAFQGVVTGKAGAIRPEPLHLQHGFIGRYKDGETSQTAEYRAVIAALRWVLLKHSSDRVEIRTDSQFVERQIAGIYACRAPHLLQYRDAGQELLKQLPNTRLVWVPRNENDVADALTRIALIEVRKRA